jgi:AraC-like DNA-binding protein
MQHVIDSDRVTQGRRSVYLHEVVEASPLPLIDLSRSRFDDDDFHVRFSGRLLGDAYLTHFEASSVVLARSEKEISERSSEMLLLAMLNNGSYEQSFCYHDAFPRTGPGDMLLLDLDGPQTVSFAKQSVTTCAYIPRGHFKPFLDDARLLNPVLLRPENELYGLLVACFSACCAMQSPQPAASTAALSTLTRLAMIAQGLHPLAHPDLQCSVRDARRQRAQQFIARHCDNPRLTPQAIADHLGVSLRSLNMAFERSGVGVAGSILAARLDWAKGMLINCPQRSVLDVALAFGFINLSSLYLRFAKSFGAAPGEFRRIAQIENDDFADRHDARVANL